MSLLQALVHIFQPSLSDTAQTDALPGGLPLNHDTLTRPTYPEPEQSQEPGNTTILALRSRVLMGCLWGQGTGTGTGVCRLC